MRRYSVPTIIVTGLFFTSWLVGAVRVAPESECSRFCGNVLDDTRADDVVCDEDAYGSGTGKVFSGCVSCELTSPYVYQSGKPQQQTDQQWLLYNIRFATSYCLFGFPGSNAESNPCITSRACEPLLGPMTFGNLSQTGGPYDYCAVWDSSRVGGCNACLRAGNRHILSNLITMLDTGCRQQPIPGLPISVEGNPFSTDVVNTTEPIPTLNATYDTRDGFPLGASVGIAVGALVLLLGVAGCLIIWNGKRRRRAFLRRAEELNKQKGGVDVGVVGIGVPTLRPAASADSSWHNTVSPASDRHDTPLSQRPLRSAWDDSPMSAYTDRTLPRYWSPYTSPVSGEENAPTDQQFGSRLPEKTMHHGSSSAPASAVGDISGAIGAVGDLISWGGTSPKGKEKEVTTPEVYEMSHTRHHPHVHNRPAAGSEPGLTQIPMQIPVQVPVQIPMQMPMQPQAPLLRHPGNGRYSQTGTPRETESGW